MADPARGRIVISDKENNVLGTIEMVAVEIRTSSQDTQWYSQGEFATLDEISWYNERHGWCKARPAAHVEETS